MTELPSDYSTYIHRSRYARFRDDLGRRETWDETVSRLCDFWLGRYPELADEIAEIKESILNLDVMPSMRSLMTAGEALDRDEVAGYNCAFTVIDSPRSFDEIMYVLLCGTGMGFSVQSKYVSKLPEIAEEMHETDTTIVVADSKIGWASAFRELISLLYAGKIPNWDMSKVRPAGARLKTFGGRASGPEPLEDLFNFSVSLFRHATGRKLTTLECHDLVCKVAEIVVVGGVRRSALISLSDLSDDRMRHAKSGQWWVDQPQRALANNSYVAEDKPDFQTFLGEWTSLYESRSGERGIFSLPAAQKVASRNGRRDGSKIVGTNPCSEILLRDKQMCNLSEVVIRPDDNKETLKKKIRLATILGTLQSTLTNFRYLRKKWKDNCEEERLLGVSLTGICDNSLMNDPHELFYSGDVLGELQVYADEVNKEYAEKLGINQSAAITCVKPSGTVSQLVDSASGIHPRFAPYYIRRVRNDKKDPLSQFLIDEGFPYEEDVMNKQTYVFSFPMKSPAGAENTDTLDGMQQLHLWETYARYWCQHKPSMTAYYNDNDFLEMGNWIWNNFDEVSGVSFLPKSDHTYQQAPYEEITEEQYNKMLESMPTDVDWSRLTLYEQDDHTSGTQELACTAGGCEL